MTPLTTRAFTRRATATLFAATAVAASATTAAAASTTPVADDPLAMFDTPAIDAVIAGAENASPDCAALSAFMGVALFVGFASMDPESGLGEHGDELVFATASPVLVPLLNRASTPTDPAVAAGVELITTDLTATIDELRGLGVTDEQLLEFQAQWANDFDDDDSNDPDETGSTTVDPWTDPASPISTLVGHDFESITFLDGESPGGIEGGMPWAESCPETVAEFEFA